MTFLLQQLFMQIVVFLRQSGTTDALIDQAMDNILFPLLHALKLSEFKYNVVKQTDQLADPVYVLQSIARKSIQFDIAQVTALILTPIVISFFTWRDGVFTLEGTGILVHHCNLRLIWIRFLVLLCFYPIGSSLGRWLLEHKMRTTLLGKPTLHGTSRVIGKMRQEARIKQMAKAKAASARRRSVMELDDDAETKQLESLDLTEEERAAVGDELLVSQLNFRLLLIRQLKHVGFFTQVVLLQLFVTFRVRTTALKASVANPAASLAAEEFAISASTPLATANSTSDHWYILQPQSVWTFVNPVDKCLSDEKLLEAMNASSTFLNCAEYSENISRAGWVQSISDPTVKAVVGVAVSLAVISFTLLVLFRQAWPDRAAMSALATAVRERRKSKKEPAVLEVAINVPSEPATASADYV